MGRKRNKRGRDISGILILDKPTGMTSNGALQYVKRLYNAQKAGHTGSLDKPASGLLPICLGEATKFSSYLLNSDKVYRTRGRLGVTTTTGDASGDEIETRPVQKITQAQLNKVIDNFIGEIEQIPPMYSALKQDGKRLYKLAYEGKEVERKPRKVKINSIKLLEQTDTEFEIEVSCTKGTYIRTLVEDIGEKLDCGAHVLSLRRLSVSNFIESDMVSPESIEKIADDTKNLDSLLLPVDAGLNHIPDMHLSEEQAYYLCRGQSVKASRLPKSGQIRIYNEDDQFIGLGEVTKESMLSPKRLINMGNM